MEGPRRFLLACGVLSSLLFLLTDFIAALLYAGYSFISQAISELFAIGAPTGWLVVPLFTAADVSLLAFSVGIWIRLQGTGPFASLL